MSNTTTYMCVCVCYTRQYFKHPVMYEIKKNLSRKELFIKCKTHLTSLHISVYINTLYLSNIYTPFLLLT
jgi:hypothetical protein